MVRKYEAFIDGKPLIIGDEPENTGLFDGLLPLRVRTAADIRDAVKRSRAEGDLRGLYLFGGDPDELWDLFASGYRPVQAAGGCVTDELGRLLAIHRLGVWDLPKGKVEEGETVEAGALREVREECGLRHVELVQRLCATWHTYERKGHDHLKRTDWYWMRASYKEELLAQAEEDISEVRWMDEGGLEEMRRSTYPSLQGVISAWERAVRRPV